MQTWPEQEERKTETFKILNFILELSQRIKPKHIELHNMFTGSSSLNIWLKSESSLVYVLNIRVATFRQEPYTDKITYMLRTAERTKEEDSVTNDKYDEDSKKDSVMYEWALANIATWMINSIESIKFNKRKYQMNNDENKILDNDVFLTIDKQRKAKGMSCGLACSREYYKNINEPKTSVHTKSGMILDDLMPVTIVHNANWEKADIEYIIFYDNNLFNSFVNTFNGGGNDWWGIYIASIKEGNEEDLTAIELWNKGGMKKFCVSNLETLHDDKES